jgi:ribosomal protein L36
MFYGLHSEQLILDDSARNEESYFSIVKKADIISRSGVVKRMGRIYVTCEQ